MGDSRVLAHPLYLETVLDVYCGGDPEVCAEGVVQLGVVQQGVDGLVGERLVAGDGREHAQHLAQGALADVLPHARVDGLVHRLPCAIDTPTAYS